MKTPTHLFIRDFRIAQPTEFAWNRFAGNNEYKMNIEYGHEKRGEGWWYWRKASDESIVVNIPSLDIENQEGIVVLWFGPYPDERMCIEQLEYARRHDTLTMGGGTSQNINAPSERAMINDIFAWGGLGIDAFKPRRG